MSNKKNMCYEIIMRIGRPSKKPRSKFGENLQSLRKKAGLSQGQLAAKVNISQRGYAFWERNPVALRPDQFIKLASELEVSMEELFGVSDLKNKNFGPEGKLKRVFQAASKLSRSQQQKILSVLEAFVIQNANGH